MEFEVITFDVKSGTALAEKIHELHQDGWEVTAMMPLVYRKAQAYGQDQYEISRVVLTLKRMEG